MTDTKPCIICGATITRTAGTDREWAKRAYCSRTCIWVTRKAEAEAAALSDRSCAACHRPMTRPAKMSRTQWATRRHCSPACRNSTAREVCEMCNGPLPCRRKAKLPWCSGPCKKRWQAANPVAPIPRRQVRDDGTQPPVRFRSELLAEDAPRRTWIQREPGRIAVCCGHCRRRFPRATIRLAERLRDLHQRTCAS